MGRVFPSLSPTFLCLAVCCLRFSFSTFLFFLGLLTSFPLIRRFCARTFFRVFLLFSYMLMLHCACLCVLLSSMLGSSSSSSSPTPPLSAPSPVASLLSVRFRTPTLGLRLSIAAFFLPSGRLQLLRGCCGFIIQLPLLRWQLAVFSCYYSLIFIRSVVFFSSPSFDHPPFIPFPHPLSSLAFLTGVFFAYAVFLTRSLAHGESFFHVDVYCLFSLAFFFLGPSSGCGCVSFPCIYSLCCPTSLSMRLLLRGYSYGLSLLAVHSTRFFFSFPHLSCAVYYLLPLLLVPPPPPSSFGGLPCLGLGYRCYLLTSPSLIYLRVLRGGLYTRRSSSLGVDQCFCSCLFSFRGYSYSLHIFFYVYPAITARVFSAIIRSRSPLSRRFTSTLFYCLPPGYFPRLSYPSTPFRVFYYIRLLPCDFTLALLCFISSVLTGFSPSIVLFLCGIFMHCSCARLIYCQQTYPCI